MSSQLEEFKEGLDSLDICTYNDITMNAILYHLFHSHPNLKY